MDETTFYLVVHSEWASNFTGICILRQRRQKQNQNQKMARKRAKGSRRIQRGIKVHRKSSTRQTKWSAIFLLSQHNMQNISSAKRTIAQYYTNRMIWVWICVLCDVCKFGQHQSSNRNMSNVDITYNINCVENIS